MFNLWASGTVRSMSAEDGASLLIRRAAVVPQGVPLATEAVVTAGSGARLTRDDGRSLIDFASGIGVCVAGHCPAPVVEAIQRQAERLMHTCIHVATYEPYVALCERLVSLFPHGPPESATKAMLVNSGAEAVENAVKIARQATQRPGVICFTGAFHGRTLLGMSLTSKVGYKLGCGPFAPEVYRLPFPSPYHDAGGLAVDRFVARELARLRDALHTHVDAENIAAIIIEPILGEGGFIPAPPGYLRGLREICNTHGIVLIFDEVQTGFGRTGRMAAYQHYGVTPDLSTWAKALGGGLPIAAVVGRADVMDAARPGTIGGTYGGNPVACAGALAQLDLIDSQNLCARAVDIGTKIHRCFDGLRAQTKLVGDVRGVGAMVAMELVEDADPLRPATETTQQILRGCLDRGVLLIAAGVHGNVIRVLCPLTIDDADLERGLDVISHELLKRAV